MCGSLEGTAAGIGASWAPSDTARSLGLLYPRKDDPWTKEEKKRRKRVQDQRDSSLGV